MGKGTPSMGKRNKPTHMKCRRCGNRSFHKRLRHCASCGFGRMKRIRTRRINRIRKYPTPTRPNLPKPIFA